MEGLDLSSLEKSVVEAAAIPSSKPEEPVTPKVEIPIEPITPKPAEPVVETPAEPVVIPTPTPEDLEKVIEVIDQVVDPNAIDPLDKGKEGEESNIYPALAGFLKDKGIFDDGAEIKDEDSFVAAISKTIEDSKFSGLSEKQKLYLDAIESGIEDKVAKGIIQDIDSLQKITETTLTENTALAENFIKNDLLVQGWSEDRIAKQIERLKASNEIVSEGLIAKDNVLKSNLNAIEDKKQAVADANKIAKEKEDKQLSKLKDSIFKETKALSTVTADDKLKNRVYESMTVPVAYKEDGSPLNALMKDRADDPVDFEKRLYYAYVITDGFRDTKLLQRRADSSAARKLKDAVAGMHIGLSGEGTPIHKEEPKDMPDIVSV